MTTDLSYVLENENDEYYRLRIGMKNEEKESVSFDGDFAILKHDKHTRIFLFDNKEGLVAGIHLKEENDKNNVQAMYTKPQHRKKGYMNHLVSYAKSIDNRFDFGNDLTPDGEYFINSFKEIEYANPSMQKKKIKTNITKAHYKLMHCIVSRYDKGSLQDKIKKVKEKRILLTTNLQENQLKLKKSNIKNKNIF